MQVSKKYAVQLIWQMETTVIVTAYNADEAKELAYPDEDVAPGVGTYISDSIEVENVTEQK